MKKLIFCLAFLAFFVSCEPAVSSSSFAGITGEVIDLDTRDAIEGANVNLSPSGKNTFTGDEGHFDFQELDPKEYKVNVQKDCYEPNRMTVMTFAGEVEDITLTLKKCICDDSTHRCVKEKK